MTTVFASRWKALGWSAGVLLTAYCSIPATDQDDPTGLAADPATAGQSNGTIASPAAGHVSPWAITPPPHK